MPITMLNTSTTYTNANVGDLIKLLTPELVSRGRSLKELGRRLGQMVKPGSAAASFAGISDLADHLIKTYDSGVSRQARGDELENLAAQYIGGSMAKGDTIPDWAVPFVKNNGNDRDPDLYETAQKDTALTIKPDVWSDSVVGIVGGAAKDGNLGKFKGICGQLNDLCQIHGKTPMVFADGATPQRVIDAAKEAVGGANVLVLQADDSWLAQS